MKVYVLTTDKRKHLESITKPEWIKISKDITYWNNTGHHPGHGRNRILEDFYLNHTDQWCVIADDDNIIDPARGYYNRFIDQLDYVLETVSANDIATFGFLNNIVHGVDARIFNNRILGGFRVGFQLCGSIDHTPEEDRTMVYGNLMIGGGTFFRWTTISGAYSLDGVRLFNNTIVNLVGGEGGAFHLQGLHHQMPELNPRQITFYNNLAANCPCR